MKVLLYFEKQKYIKQSGIGRALLHQKKALELAEVDYTLEYRDTPYDFAHINTLFTDSYRVLKKCKKKQLPVIVHGHSTIEDFRNSFRAWKFIALFFNRMILRMYRHADAIITPTPYSKRLIEAYKGVNCPVYAVSNGIQLEEYAYDEAKALKFDEFFHIRDKKIVICAGLYFERKGITDFFEVARRMPDVQFIWFGHLKRILTQPKILRAIRKRPKNVLLPGYMNDELRGAFHRADAFLFLSKEETEGIVILEALASRLPVIVRDIPVFSDWLTDGKEVLKGKTVDDFTRQLTYVFEHDMTEMTEAGYKVVEERTLDKVGKQLREIYETVSERKA